LSYNVHNPDQYMASLRPLIAQGRKCIGLLIGAGAPVSLVDATTKKPLIPAVAGLTNEVINTLNGKYGTVIKALKAEMTDFNIETLLSRIRSLGSVIGSTNVQGLDGKGYQALSEEICREIGKVVDKRLPSGSSPYTDLVSWISGTSREHPIEVFTTNYDLLLEEAMERAGIPFFDGFSGAREPFFDPSSVAANDLPARWTRIWKLHGSLGWSANEAGEVIRKGGSHSTHLVFPEHLKYDRTQKAPYAALFDRLRAFLNTPDTLLITTGFSFADSHISALLGECLAANPSANIFAFQYKTLAEEPSAKSIAAKRGNMSVYCPNGAVINGIEAPWRPGNPPTRDWDSIRATYWSSGKNAEFTLGSFTNLARFFASSRSTQEADPANVVMMPVVTQPATGQPGIVVAIAAAEETDGGN
jgi:hypothetical protein